MTWEDLLDKYGNKEDDECCFIHYINKSWKKRIYCDVDGSVTITFGSEYSESVIKLNNRTPDQVDMLIKGLE